MEKELIELIKEDAAYKENKHNKTEQDLIKYITERARVHLKGIDGAISSDIVKGWAIHFYIETNEDLEKETAFLSKDKTEKPTRPKNAIPAKKEVVKKPKKEDNQLTLEDFGL